MIKYQVGITLIELSIVLMILIALSGVAIPMVGNTVGYAQCVATDATMNNIKSAIIGNQSMMGYYKDMGVYPIKKSTCNGTSACVGSLDWMVSNPLTLPNQDNQCRGGDSSPYNICSISNSLCVLSEGCYTVVNETAITFDVNRQRGWRGPYLSNTDSASSSTGLLDNFYSARRQRQEIKAVHYLESNHDYYYLVSAGPDGVLDITWDVNPVNTAFKFGDDRLLFINTPDPRVRDNVDCGQLK